jgi:CDP-diacylglycerol--serine O-phosphatidyltransferase
MSLGPKPFFIVRLNLPGILTLSGLALDLAAFFLLLDAGSSGPDGRPPAGLFLAASLMYLGMLADAFDGFVARRFGLESEFGRYLDGFVDVFNYLVLPSMILWGLGFRGPWAGVCLGLLVTCGVLRLSRFNQIGTVDEGGQAKYLGLPVFWTQLALAPLFLVWSFAPSAWFHVAASVVGLGLAFAFVWNRNFYKPKNPWVMAALILALAAASFLLFLGRINP